MTESKHWVRLSQAEQFRIVELMGENEIYALITDDFHKVMEFINEHKIEKSHKYKIYAMVVLETAPHPIGTFTPAEFAVWYKVQENKNGHA